MQQTSEQSQTALSGVKVLDLSRVLAGPWATQILADLGADVFKIENPAGGDDTRVWGPPFVEDAVNNRRDAAYFTCANRNKKSVCVDFAKPEGVELIKKLAAEADILVENFKLGGLKKFGLDYESIRRINPRIVYCSVTGFSQSGPYAHRPGYDFLLQGMGGLMSITGHPEQDGASEPLKAGVAVCDLFTGMYAAVSILAALNHQRQTGQGQHLDCSLLSSQVAMLANQGASHLIGGVTPKRMGNKHPAVVPYQVFPVADGHVIITCGNDRQFAALCGALEAPEMSADPLFATNEQRILHRDELERQLNALLGKLTRAEVLQRLENCGVPAGPINTIPDVFEDPQVQHMEMRVDMERGDGKPIPTVAFPVKMSETPAQYHKAPPVLGSDTLQVLAEQLHLSAQEIDRLVTAGVVK
jgi:crotonobetainyl-CoA:carnitine CoA-transferase CaiB-like acyl-CoA transferase